MNEDLIHRAMTRLADESKKKYGSRLKQVILFGSCARGDFGWDSDVDVMILLDVAKEDIEDEQEKIYPIIHDLDIEFDYEVLFAPIVESQRVFDQSVEVLPFYETVKREGVRYV